MTTNTLEPLHAAIHSHLQSIASRPFDARMLAELEHTCRLARQLVAVGQMPDAFAKQQMFGGQVINGGAIMPYEPSSFVSPAGGNPTETFGVQAIKELVALLPEIMPKPAPALELPPPGVNYGELASAMAIAKGAGDEKLYDQLFARLEADQRRAELENKKLETAKTEAA